MLNTPFTGDNQLDTIGLRRNGQAAIEAGVAGFLVPAMAGEVSKLSRAERGQMVEQEADRLTERVMRISAKHENLG